MKELRFSLNQRQKVRFLRALQQLHDSSTSKINDSASVAVADTIPVNHEDGFLKGHGTSEVNGEVVATLCGMVERVNKLVLVRALRARYKPEVGEIIVGRVIEVATKRWRLEINFSQAAVLMLSSMNLPDGIQALKLSLHFRPEIHMELQRRRTAVDELNMRSIFEENDVVCAEVRGFQHDGSLHLQARSQKYGKLERGQLLTVPPYLVKRRKQHFHHLEQLGVDLILGCNGFIWIGEHIETSVSSAMEDEESKSEEINKSITRFVSLNEEDTDFTPFNTRQNICRIANAIRILSVLGFALSVETIVDTVEASVSSKIGIGDMLGAEFYVQTAEREVLRRSLRTKKKG